MGYTWIHMTEQDAIEYMVQQEELLAQEHKDHVNGKCVGSPHCEYCYEEEMRQEFEEEQ